MKIAIMTQPLGHNYGGILQNYALKKVLEQFGSTVLTVNRRPKARSKKFKVRSHLSSLKNKTFNKLNGNYYHKLTKGDLEFIYSENLSFINQYINLSDEIQSTKDLKNYFDKDNFDAVIVGSDQTWRPRYSPCITNYFLDFLVDNKSINKVAYACSFGTSNWEFSEAQYKQCKKLISNFNAISVRESSGIDICRKFFKTEAQLVLDPTLLLEKQDYIDLIESKLGDVSSLNRGLFNYILDDTKEKNELVERLALHLNTDSFRTQPHKKLPVIGKKNLVDYRYPSIEEWLSSFYTADYIVTDSFHGTVLSIIFEKPFLVMVNKDRGAARFESFLNLLGLQNRMFHSISNIDVTILEEEIDYGTIKSKLEPLKLLSFSFLDSALDLSGQN